MNFIDSWALSISNFIRTNNTKAASEKVLFYALSLLINTFIACLTVILICTVTGHLHQAILVIFFYTMLRFFSGGSHLSSSLGCCIFSIIMFSVLAHIDFSFNLFYLGYILTTITAIILLVTAPQGIQNISRISPKYYIVLKIISVLIVLVNFHFESSYLAVAFFIQAFQTTPFSYKLLILFERRIH